jgi:hypothetical protein
MLERTGLCYIKNVPRQLPRVAACLCTIASMQDGRIKSRELTASVVGRRGPVVIRTWNRATADGQICRNIASPVRATKTRQT